jgi:hypothetical protein
MIYYLALRFTEVDGGLAPGQAVERMSGAAIRRTEAHGSEPSQCRRRRVLAQR